MTDIVPFILAPDDPNKVRFVGDIAARYFLEGWNGTGRKPAYCRVRNVNRKTATFVVTEGANRGDKASVGIPEIGVIRGRITRAIGALYTLELNMCDPSRAELMSRLNWMVRRKAYGLRERRTMGRFPLQDPQSAVSVEGSPYNTCNIVNASRTGVLLESDLPARVGDECQVGYLQGVVARLTENGFAVQFKDVVEDSSLVPELLSLDLPRVESGIVFML